MCASVWVRHRKGETKRKKKQRNREKKPIVVFRVASSHQNAFR